MYCNGYFGFFKKPFLKSSKLPIFFKNGPNLNSSV